MRRKGMCSVPFESTKPPFCWNILCCSVAMLRAPTGARALGEEREREKK